MPPKEFYDFTNEINRIGVNINQLAKVANMTDHIMEEELKLQYSQLRGILSEIRGIYLGHRGWEDGNDKDLGD